uniref:Platelet-activating factor receptor n=2 Tax=Pygocentrus nattereri TaxID=42514 RepID=A0A3B4D2U8_PYGNA
MLINTVLCSQLFSMAALVTSRDLVTMTTDENHISGNETFLDSQFRYSLFPAFYGLVFILGLLANIYALFILRHMRDAKAMNEIRIYMTNLTVADLLFILILPFWIDYYRNNGNWNSSEALCRIAGAMYFINTYCSVLFLTVISINRYWAVTRPLVAASSDCWRRGIIVSFIVWLITLAATAKQLTDRGIQKDGNISRCFEGYHNQSRKEKIAVAVAHFIIIAIFFVVFMLVILCNVLIANTLLKQPISQPRPSTGRRPQGTKRRALRMLCAVIGVFVVCFVPHHVVQGPWTLAVLDLMKWNQETRQRLNDAHQITLMLMGLNCLLDPVVYCFATRKFRKYIQGHLRKVKDGKACSTNTTITGVSMKVKHQNELVSVFEDSKE